MLIASRVIPASGPVIIRSSPNILLTSVDLPALGRPTIASFSGPENASSSSSPSSSASCFTSTASSNGASDSNRSASPSPCSALNGTGSPKPSAKDSYTPAFPADPSALFAISTTGVVELRSQRAISSSSGVIPARESMTKIATSAMSTAACVCWRMRPGKVAASSSSNPAVSTIRKSRPSRLASPSRRSRVTPGRSSTSAMRLPTSRLNSVDLPTLGRPIIATIGFMI